MIYKKDFSDLKINMGVIGLGQRGAMLIRTMLACEECEIVAVCDVYEDRVADSQKVVFEKRGNTPVGYSSYEELLKDENVDAVLISAAWEAHVDLAVACMEAGKIVALEVGGAYCVEDCWRLVDAYERTKTPIMFMENCCWDSFEMFATSLCRNGALGELVHCHGAYSHDLRDEILGGNVNRHYRLKNYIERNCENYPTHELGPIAKILDINRGNKFLSLVSISSKAVGLEAFAKTDKNPDKSLIGQHFKQGDIVNTIITCENGETITLTLDTTLPKYYSREFTVRGTKGLCNQENNMVFFDGIHSPHEFWEPRKFVIKYSDNADKYSDYQVHEWRDMTEKEKTLGHGGMDYLMFKAFFKTIKEGKPFALDVYDAASWMVVTALSAKSIEAGGAPQEIPDFTRGEYKNRPRLDVTEFPNIGPDGIKGKEPVYVEPAPEKKEDKKDEE